MLCKHYFSLYKPHNICQGELCNVGESLLNHIISSSGAVQCWANLIKPYNIFMGAVQCRENIILASFKHMISS